MNLFAGCVSFVSGVAWLVLVGGSGGQKEVGIPPDLFVLLLLLPLSSGVSALVWLLLVLLPELAVSESLVETLLSG